MHLLVRFIAEDLILISFAAVLLVFFKLARKRRLEYVAFVFVSAAITLLLVKLAAHLHHDPRPFVADGVKAFVRSAKDQGFPSDHTVTSVFCALVVLRYHRVAGSGLFILALLIGWSRVYGNVHHAQDIVGGFVVALIGVGLGYLISDHLPSKLTRQKS